MSDVQDLRFEKMLGAMRGVLIDAAATAEVLEDEWHSGNIHFEDLFQVYIVTEEKLNTCMYLLYRTGAKLNDITDPVTELYASLQEEYDKIRIRISVLTLAESVLKDPHVRKEVADIVNPIKRPSDEVRESIKAKLSSYSLGSDKLSIEDVQSLIRDIEASSD